MAEESRGKEVKLHLIGTPEGIASHIARVAENFHFRDLEYRAQEERYKSSQFSKQFRILCGSDFSPAVHWIGEDDGIILQIYPKKENTKFPQLIGIITLQSLPNNKTLLIAEHISSSFDSDACFYDNFLKNLFSELKELGFVETLPKKLWRVVKELIGIAKVVKP